MSRLAAAGLGPPALLVGGAKRTARERFVAAVLDHGRKAGWQADKITFENGKYTVEGGRDAMRRVLTRSQPDSVFASNDLMALGALQAVRDVGLSCPDDVAILGFDGIPAGEVSRRGSRRSPNPLARSAPAPSRFSPDVSRAPTGPST